MRMHRCEVKHRGKGGGQGRLICYGQSARGETNRKFGVNARAAEAPGRAHRQDVADWREEKKRAHNRCKQGRDAGVRVDTSPHWPGTAPKLRKSQVIVRKTSRSPQRRLARQRLEWLLVDGERLVRGLAAAGWARRLAHRACERVLDHLFQPAVPPLKA